MTKVAFCIIPCPEQVNFYVYLCRMDNSTFSILRVKTMDSMKSTRPVVMVQVRRQKSWRQRHQIRSTLRNDKQFLAFFQNLRGSGHYELKSHRLQPELRDRENAPLVQTTALIPTGDAHVSL